MTDQLDDLIAIQMVVAALGLHVDARRWAELEALFVPDRVELDYRSLVGGDVTHPSARDVVGAWAALLPGFTTTHHAIGPPVIEVRGLHAAAEAAVVGSHWIDEATFMGGNSWIVIGRYRLRLEKHDDRWLIAALTLIATRQEGNQALPQEAAKRVSLAL